MAPKVTLSKESEVIIDAFAKEAGVTEDHIKNLRGLLNGSPVLAQQFNDAVKAKQVTALHPLTNPNAGGEFSPGDKSIHLPLANLETPKGGKFDNADMTFVLGHELQHAENAKASEKVLETVWQGMNDKAKEAKQPHDYTALVDQLIDSNRRDEAGAEIAGWNAAVSRLQASGTEKPTYKQLYEANPFRMADFIDKSPGNPATYTLKDGLKVKDDMTMEASDANIKAMGKYYFDQAGTDTRLGQKANADYPNYYGAYAIGLIAQAERTHNPPGKGESQQPVALDLAKLKLSESAMEDCGMDLGGAANKQVYIDTGDKSKTPKTFDHTRTPPAPTAGKDTGKPAPHDPAHGDHRDHALYQQLRDGVERLERAHGRSYGDSSERLTASLLASAKQSGLEKVDQVTLSADGQRVFAMQGQPDDLDRRHAGVDVTQALSTSREQSLQQLQAQHEARHAAAAKDMPQQQAPRNEPGLAM